ncbi:hypothetical protein [Parasphingorhabdus sp.]|uniref:hypothetical protein n=1 Tax=Parasphingorhabdus sp. TaxID=2709688 RepID=UPI002F94A0B9
MTEARKFFVRHHWLCAMLFGAALLMKAVIPAGFMPVVSQDVILVQLCTGQGAQTIAMTVPGKTDNGEHDKSEMPCAFTGLSSPALAAADPLLLAIAIAFVIAAGIRLQSHIVLWRRIYLRPPAIGPPSA